MKNWTIQELAVDQTGTEGGQTGTGIRPRRNLKLNKQSQGEIQKDYSGTGSRPSRSKKQVKQELESDQPRRSRPRRSRKQVNIGGGN